MTEALALTDATFDRIVDDLGKKLDLAPVNLQRGTYVENSLASGALALDLILGGGWPGGRWSGAVGGEGSGKSTLSFFAMAAATRQHVPVFHFDAEGAADPSYMQRIGLQTDWRAEQAAGQRALYRYYQPEYGEQVFRFMARVLKAMPDAGPKDRIQAMFILDSLPFLQPERRYDDDEAHPMAQQAKMYADNIPLIKSQLSAKNCVLFAVNQIRLRPGVSYGCLHADTNIRFADGRVFTIKEIVNGKIEGDVMAYVDGKLEPRRIVNWFNNGQSNPEDWVTIETDGPGSGCGFHRLTVTMDHKVLTQRGWVAARELDPGEDVLHTSYERRFNPGTSAEKFLLGTVIGDTCIPKSGMDRGILKMQDNQNPDYIEWKVKKLSRLVAFSTYPVRKLKDFVCHVSDVRQEFDVLKEQIENRNPALILDRVDLMSLAVWFMDDGHFDDSKGHACGVISIKRLRHDTASIDKIAAYFTGLGYDARSQYSDGSVHFNVASFQRLSRDIAKYVPPCMQYKLRPEDRGKYVDFELDGGKPKVLARPVAIRDIHYGLTARRARQLGKYDLEVEGVHNYQAGSSRGGLVVHNSPIYEPCGEAAKHASDVRLMTSSRSVPSGKGGKVEEEGCWDGKGKDRYVYAIMRTVKHKMFSPFRETWMRIWFEEKGMPGRGIDPVYDTYQYLMMTDQMKEARGFFTMELDGYTGTSRLTWDQFKALILSPDARKEPGTAVRAMCRRQFATGEAFDRYFGASGGGLGQRAGADVMDADAVETLGDKAADPTTPADEPKLPARKRGRKPAAAQLDDAPATSTGDE